MDSQASRLLPTKVERLDSQPTFIDAGGMLAGNSKTEGRGFARPSQSHPLRQLISGSAV